MAEIPGEDRVEPSGPLAKACAFIGGGALLAAMAIDFVSVVGRHLGFRIVGALELVQYCITGIVSAAVVIATLSDGHAAVHVLTERLRAPWRAVLARFSDLLSALFFAAILAGDLWIAVELFTRDERSDLLGLPVSPMRLLWCLAQALAGLICLRMLLLGKRKEGAGRDA